MIELDCNWVNRKYFSLKEIASFQRSGSCKIKSMNGETAVFSGSAEYKTSLRSCTCPDYSKVLFPVPCKHMFYLAKELGYFANRENLLSVFDTPKESDTLSLYKDGEFLPQQFAYFFDKKRNEWLFGLNRPVKVEIRSGRKKKVVESYLGFSIGLEEPIAVLKPIDSSVMLEKAEYDLYVEPASGLCIQIVSHHPESKFKVEPEDMYAERNLANDFLYALVNESQLPVILGEQKNVSFKIPIVFFFKQAYEFAIREVGDSINNPAFTSDVFTMIL